MVKPVPATTRITELAVKSSTFLAAVEVNSTRSPLVTPAEVKPTIDPA